MIQLPAVFFGICYAGYVLHVGALCSVVLLSNYEDALARLSETPSSGKRQDFECWPTVDVVSSTQLHYSHLGILQQIGW